MSIIYHTGLTSPPTVDIDGFKICHYAILKVEYESYNAPQDIIDYMKLNPIILMMSKNAVIGLDKWLSNFGFQPDFFADSDFWTVGNRTHICLKNILMIQSFYPNQMTGKGVLEALEKQNHSRVLLIAGHNIRKEFIDGLSSVGINFFHFPVYKTSIDENSEFYSQFKNDKSDYLIITSPSGVVGILASLSFQNLSKVKSRLISIGPTTSAAIRQNGGDVFFESEDQNINVLYQNLDSIIHEPSHT